MMYPVCVSDTLDSVNGLVHGTSRDMYVCPFEF
jgi:hypothetical protein